MSPLEIPGSVLKLINLPGKYTCPSCKRDYSSAKIKQVGNTIVKSCPKCNYTIKTYSLPALKKKVATKK